MTRLPSLPGLPTLGSTTVSRRRSPAPPPLSSEEERGLLKELGYGALSGLATVGHILDTPGSVVRGVLAGEPLRAVKGVISPQERVYGRELLESWDVLGPNRKGFDWGDVAGFGASVATDPLLGLSLGMRVVTPAGKALKAIPGLLEKAGIAETAKRAGVLGQANQSQATKILAERALQATSGLTGKALKAANKNVLKAAGKREGLANATLGDIMSLLKGDVLAAGPGAASRTAKEALGAAEKAIGNYAKHAGRTVESLMGQKLGGVAGYGFPFMDPLVVGGTGPMWQAVARGMDVVGRTVADSKVGLTLAHLFHAPSEIKGGLAGLTPEAQHVQRMAHAATLEGTKAGKSLSVRAAQTLEEARLAGEPVEGLIHVRDIAEGFISRADAEATTPGIVEAAQMFWTRIKQQIPEARDLGAGLGTLVDENVGFWARQLTKPVGGRGADLATVELLSTLTAKRAASFRGIPEKAGEAGWGGFTSHFIRLAQHPDVLKAKQVTMEAVTASQKQNAKEAFTLVVKRVAREQAIPDQMVTNKGLKAWAAAQERGATVAEIAEEVATKGGRHKVLADTMHDNFTLAQLEVGIFGNHPMADMGVRIQAWEEYIRVIPTLYDGIAMNASKAPKGEGLITIGELLKKKGGKKKGGLGLRQTTKVDDGSVSGAIPHIARRLGIALPAVGEKGHKAAVKRIAQMTVTKDFADSVLRIGGAYSGGKAAKQVLSLADGFLNLWKVGVTTVNPAFHTRNFVSALFRSYVDGTFSAKDFRSGWRLMRGGTVADAHLYPEVAAILTERGLPGNAKEGTKVLRELVFANEVVTRETGEAAARVGATAGAEAKARTFEGGLREIVGERAAKIEDVAKTVLGRSDDAGLGLQDLLTIRGAGSPVTRNAIVKGGEEMGAIVEGTTRLMPFINQLRKGSAGSASAAQRVALAQVDYASKAFTAFESDVLKRIFPFYCVPIDTEILTRRGFKRHDELTVGEDVLAMDHSDGTVHWTPLEAVNVFDFDGELLGSEYGRGHRDNTILFTENHRWPVITAVGGHDYTRLDGTTGHTEGGGKRKFLEGKDLKKWHSVPTAGDYQGKESLLSPRLAAILGWVVTDGHFRRRDTCTNPLRGWEMIVYQSPKKHLDEIIALLGTKPRKPHPETGVVAVPVSQTDIKALIEHFRHKDDMPGIVAELSREAADAMYDAMVKAEASTHPETGVVHFGQEGPGNAPVLEAFQMLCFMTGRAANISGRGCYVRKSNGWYPGNGLGKVPYRGQVWCPTTKYGTWLMRRNGNAIFTGNSFTSRNMAYVLRQIYEAPGGKIPQMMRALNAVRDPGSALPPHIGQTAAIPIPEDFPILGAGPNSDPRYLTGLGIMALEMTEWFKDPVLGLISRGNPLIKAPLEAAFGISSFQRGPGGGRQLRDMDPLLGRTIANMMGREDPVKFPEWLEFLLANSPVSRIISTARTLTDPRKRSTISPVPMPGIAALLNVGTGFRITDVPISATQRVVKEVAAKLIQQMPGSRQLVKHYVPEDVRANYTPEQQEHYRRLTGVDRLFLNQGAGAFVRKS